MNTVTLFLPLDLAALLVLWWCAYAGLHGGHAARDWRDTMLTVALIALKVCAFCGAIAMIVHPVPLHWWTRGTLYSSAVVAAWLYDYRFGVCRHLRMACDGVARAGSTVRGWVRRHIGGPTT